MTSTSNRLVLQPTQKGVFFHFQPASQPLPPEQWATHMRSEDRGALVLIFAAVDSGDATLQATGIEVSHPWLASLTTEQATTLGLPPAVPFVLDIKSCGTLDRDLTFDYRWLHRSRPVRDARRLGCQLIIRKHQFHIFDPQYALLESMDRFNASPPKTVEERLLAWGSMQALLNTSSEHLRADPYLTDMHVYPAHRFTLSLQARTGRDVEVSPLLLRAEDTSGSILEDTPDIKTDPPQLLPNTHEHTFTRRFGQFHEAQSRYALNDGAYVVIDPTTQRALDVVRQIQKGSVETRRDFVRNPRAYFRAALDELPEATVERLFVETEGYSERVEGLGLWQPKVVPWQKKAPYTWLPPESQGLLVDERPLELSPDEVTELRIRLEAAMNEGKSTLSFQGHRVPATLETLEALSELADGGPASSTEGDPFDAWSDATDPQDPTANHASFGTQRHVLQIKDNLEDLSFSPRQRRSRAGAVGIPPLHSILKPHQEQGLHWLQSHWCSGTSGAFLADDMGLGKTLQALAFLAWLREEMAAGTVEHHPLLIVAPTGLLKNWEDETRIHLAGAGLGQLTRAYRPDLARLKSGRAGVESQDGIQRLNRNVLHQADWILTTYETLRDYHHSFALVPFNVIVFDEVQKIKNPAAMVTETAKAMRADFILTLTGTPVENRLADLWCIADVTQPGMLGDLKSFSLRYEGNENEEALRELKSKIWQVDSDRRRGPPALMLRRLKEDNLPSLPAKHPHVLKRMMPAPQAARYQEAIDQARFGKNSMLQTLQRLRQLSLHPDLEAPLDDEAYIETSARLCITIEVLDHIRNVDEKALVFVESLVMQEVLSLLLQRRYQLPQRPMLINGKVSGDTRKRRVDQFQARTGFDVMILSPRAGGVGLTLTAANHVIHLSRWWNPAVEDQCTDRVHRIGQSRSVHVYHPIALDPRAPEYSFDQRLHALLEDKRRLSQQLLVPSAMDGADEARLYRATVEQSDGGGNGECPGTR